MMSTIPGGKYKQLNGTSMAAPLVAGAISALKMVKQYDTQEILWGDLLHTGNIAEAYEVADRPAELDLLKLMYRDRKELADESEEDYSGDDELDAGETVSIYPVLRTTFGNASNIKMHLEMGEFEDASVVNILTGENNQVDFGLHLDAYGKAVSLQPLMLKIADNVANGRHVKMKLVATCDECDTPYEKDFTIVVTNMVKISGLITEDRTLTANHVYLVNNNLAVMEGATLTIEPGTRVEFAEGVELTSFGKLAANGIPGKPIVFTGHNGAVWGGIWSHESTGERKHPANLYTNEDQTLFTLLPTEMTPNRIDNWHSFATVWYSDGEVEPSRNFNLYEYVKDFTYDMTSKESLLTDPNYLTPTVLRMLSDIEAYANQYPKTEETQWEGWVRAVFLDWVTFDNPRDTISYCRIDGHNVYRNGLYPDMKDCVITSPGGNDGAYGFSSLSGVRNTITETECNLSREAFLGVTKSNIVNNIFGAYYDHNSIVQYKNLTNNNYFNTTTNLFGMDEVYWLGGVSNSPTVDRLENPSYLGTSREDIVRPYVYEFGNAPTYASIDLSNMRTTPVAEAHGIVWKVVVNGKDAQDEYEDLAPLGVGKHKFEVYFNRPMNKAVAPNISFGVREPFTQNVVNEDGSWNEEGTIYTAYKTITGKTKSDGVNRIYVDGAEDNEFFEIPYEKTRFNVMVNAAGSMATGFAAEAKMGRVALTWNNEHNNFDDAMGFNVYRYGKEHEKQVYNPHYDYETDQWMEYETIMAADTLCLNTEVLDIETTSFTDYDVIPGETYYYYYKVLSTDLKEFDVSNVVAATPLTTTLGDANGSGEVDVADVITTVNYAAGMNPKPFIFEAADMNTDKNIDILDVVGIIQRILNPTADTKARVEAVATYTVEDGIVYVETPVALAGVQVQLNAPEQTTPEVLEALNGFEHASAWLTDEDYIFLGYNMSGKTIPAGKHALLNIGNAKLRSLRLSDTVGGNVTTEAGNTTAIEMQTEKVLPTTRGIYNLNGQKVAGSANDLEKLPKGVYIVDGQKVAK